MVISRNIKLSGESKILIGFLALVGAGFLVMIIALMRSSDVAVEPVPSSDVNSLSLERSIESTRTYNKPLAVHAFNLPFERDVTPDGPTGHEQLMPNALPDDRWSSKPLEQSRMIQVPRTMPGKTTEEDEEEDRARTGWGWLADDIMSNRKPDGPGRKKDTDNRKDLGKRDELPDEEKDEDDPAKLSGRGDRDAPGKSSLMSMDEGRNSMMRPLYDFGKSGNDDRGRDRRSSPEERTDAERNPSDVDQGYEEDEYGEQKPQVAGLDARDPFVSSTEQDRPVFGSREWSFGESDTSVFRSRESIAADSSGAFSSRIVGDAASDASRLSSAWSGYASDSVFSGGGGYTPSGVSAAGSETLFSGAGVFGGGVGSSLINPIEPSSGGIAPLGGSSIGGLPSGSSSIGSGSFGGDRTTPSALPW